MIMMSSYFLWSGEYDEQTNEVQAGCRNVVELHGTNSLVTCMTCSFSIPRVTFQVKRRCFIYQPVLLSRGDWKN